MLETFSKFLTSLSATPSLFILSMGIVLLVISLSDKLPVADLKINYYGRLFLSIVASSLIIMSCWAFYKNQKDLGENKKREELERKNKDLKSENHDLTEVINRAIEVINNKQENKTNEEQQVIAILRGNSILKQIVNTPEDNYKAAEWIRNKKEFLVTQLDIDRYFDDGSSSKKISKKEFKKLIERSLDLLARNIETRYNTSPEVDNFGDKVDLEYYIYKRAMQDIATQIDDKLKKEEHILGTAQVEMIKKYIANFQQLY